MRMTLKRAGLVNGLILDFIFLRGGRTSGVENELEIG